MDDFCRMVFEYVTIISAPTLGPHLDLLLVALVVAGMAFVAVTLIVRIPTGPWATLAIVIPRATKTRLEPHASRDVRALARARAPSMAAVFRA